jgi:hypothetical protein
MEEELRYAPLSFRNPMMSKLRNYRKDLAKLYREVRSTPLTATPGGRGDMKFGAYALENEHMVSVGFFFFSFPLYGPVVQGLNSSCYQCILDFCCFSCLCSHSCIQFPFSPLVHGLFNSALSKLYAFLDYFVYI